MAKIYKGEDSSFDHHSVKPKKDEAVAYFRVAAEKHNDPQAAYEVGDAYLHGSGVPKSTEEAIKWLQKSADAGFAKAITKLGMIYSGVEGKIKPTDPQKAIQLWTKAADKGDPEACYQLGHIYKKGNGVEKNLLKTRIWFDKAIELDPLYKQKIEGVKLMTKIKESCCSKWVWFGYGLGMAMTGFAIAVIEWS